MPKDEYQTFQDHVFDVIRDMEDAELNEARQQERHTKYWARFIGRIYGLTEDEVFALRADGMPQGSGGRRSWRPESETGRRPATACNPDAGTSFVESLGHLENWEESLL